MKVDKFAISVSILLMCITTPLAAVLVTLRLTGDAAHSIRRKLGLLHQAQELVPIIDVYPTGDIPQPETSNIGNQLSVPRQGQSNIGR